MGRERILIVEDEAVVALDIRHNLETLGYSVLGAVSSGEDALQKVCDGHPDLVLMDIKLRGSLDGIETAALVHQQFHVPVVFLTAFADERTLQRVSITDAYGYILKPFELRELSVTIQMALYKFRMEQSLRDSEIRLRTIFDSVFDGLFVIDMQGRYVDVNPAACQMFGYSREEFLQSDVRLLLFPEDVTATMEVAPRRWQEGSGLREVRLRRKDGSAIWTEMTVTPIKLSGQEYALGTTRDITGRRYAQNALEESEERYRLAAQAASDGLWDWNLRNGTVYYSPRWKSILGYGNGEITTLPSDWLDRVHPEDIEKLRFEIASHLEGRTEHFESTHRILHKDGTYRWVLTRGLAVRDAHNQAYRLAGSQTDITARKKAEEQLLHDAFHDALTDLPNRSLLIERIHRAIERAYRFDSYAFGVLYLDLDHFKVVNDSLGHSVGDEVLIATAKRLNACVRSMDSIARLGGDEFAILIEDISDPSEVTQVAERIQAALQSPFSIREHTIFVSASIGIVFSSVDYQRAEEILRDADIAMYYAKTAGKARHAIFEQKMHDHAVDRLVLESELRQAIARNELGLQYQPILAIHTEEIVGFEALLRWRHSKRGLISPVDFIPVAEETGLIIELGRWALHKACRQMQTWREQYPQMEGISISVNISGKQLLFPGFFDQVMQALQQTGLPAQNLTLEITESVLMENSVVAAEVTTRLRGAGIQLHIDDFGTGYSSLSYIERFPISSIKIDRCFVEKIDQNADKGEVVRSILRLAADLGLGAIAEGVETPTQFEFLKMKSCQYVQGFLISRPLDAQDIQKTLENGKFPLAARWSVQNQEAAQ